jgi:hypothetical protein
MGGSAGELGDAVEDLVADEPAGDAAAGVTASGGRAAPELPRAGV